MPHFDWLGRAALLVLLAVPVARASDLFDRERSAEILSDPASQLTDEDLQIIEAARGLGAAAAGDPSLQGIADDGRSIIGSAMDAQAGAMSPAPGPAQDGEARPSILVFLTQGMSEGDVGTVLDDLREDRDAVAVFRGGRRGQSLGEVLTDLRRLVGDVAEGGVAPRVALDPNLFRAHAITVAPTLVWVDAHGNEIARAQGIANVAWFRREVIERGRRGDLGSFGSAVEVVELDMAEVIRERLASVDLTQQAEAARKRYWDNLDYLELPKADRARVRLLDPTFEVVETVVSPDGAVLARAGDRINPLERVPFAEVLIVFDATDPAQLELVREQLAKHRDRPMILISTVFDRDRGWPWLMQTSDALGWPLHLLRQDVRERFAIERVPTVVVSDGLRFRIEEFVAVSAIQSGARDEPAEG